MRKIRLTESELISLIKKVINEQEDGGLMASFIRDNKPRNCRGVRMKLSGYGGDGGGGFEGPGWSARAERKAAREEEREEKKELKQFNADNGINIDLEYYRILKDDRLKINNWNGNSYYQKVFNEEGKPFTPNTTQKVVNIIEGLFKDSATWYFYWKDLFGPKNPTVMDLYRHIESIGGKEGYKKLVDTGYNADVYRKRLEELVEKYNDNLSNNFPFPKPSSKTPYYFVWNEGKVQKARYFNTYEEWKYALELAKKEGNKPTSDKEDGAANSGEALFSSKPTLGTFTPQLVN
jgi:hypothetical protein